ncbi:MULTISPECIES: hypothetical protein [unclassified Streptomyces]|uniref:hypothetical protein n=1 Tax=unclassified Streptomyces TaxID=2593676 RepID=UPI002DD86242|nr:MULTISPECIES: hypothetical protein [unclassified Streptomyces]WSA92359.1 hypothetical protein OIE63_12885 [Streptomyces sp. NBC_01795]WSB76727.1 hypothetical protein OHB04_13690 [Streptomyces sp. NBC_01775]WSS14996.1 hypothetical protein OG533_26235 [Streptomyces sp. NBC_01186]WSS43840.1 hypothetical protein OG220_27050 [Streptomyces sp. NBC_01187]
MKHQKTAAVVAGSVMALGSAVPAFANEPAPGPGFSLNGGLDKALRSDTLDVAPVDGPQFDAVVNTVKGATKSGELQTGKSLLGAEKAPQLPLLGGLPLGV